MDLNSLTRWRRWDVLAIILLSIGWYGIYTILDSLDKGFYHVSFQFLLIFMFMVTHLLVKKLGAVPLFCLFGFFPQSIFGLLSAQDVSIIVLLGLFFELSVMALNVLTPPLRFVVVSSLCMAVYPWLTLFIVDALTDSLVPFATNVSIAGSLAGALSALMALVLWHHIKNSKLVVKFDYKV